MSRSTKSLSIIAFDRTANGLKHPRDLVFRRLSNCLHQVNVAFNEIQHLCPVDFPSFRRGITGIADHTGAVADQIQILEGVLVDPGQTELQRDHLVGIIGHADAPGEHRRQLLSPLGHGTVDGLPTGVRDARHVGDDRVVFEGGEELGLELGSGNQDLDIDGGLLGIQGCTVQFNEIEFQIPQLLEVEID